MGQQILGLGLFVFIFLFSMSGEATPRPHLNEDLYLYEEQKSVEQRNIVETEKAPPPGLWDGLVNDLVSFDELIAYDTYFNSRAFNREYGENRLEARPKKVILQLFIRFRNLVLEVANQFDLDPRLLVAVVTTEHSLNVKIDDIIKEKVTKVKLEEPSALSKIPISFGFGQIKISSAIDADPYVADKLQRPRFNDEQIREELNTIRGSLVYAAGILLQAIDVYDRYDVNIRNRPGILSTLYNLGRLEELAAQMGQEKREPRINYFGYYVLKHWQEFHDTVYSELPDQFNFQRATKRDMIAADDLPEDFLDRMISKQAEAEFYIGKYKTNRSIPLYLRPNACSRTFDSELNTTEEVKEFYSSDLKRVGGQEHLGEFDILQTSFGCELEEWSLIRFNQSGDMGWASHRDLAESTDYLYTPHLCEPTYKSCRQDLMGRFTSTIEKIDPRFLDLVKVEPQQEDSSIIKLPFLGFADWGKYYFVDVTKRRDECLSKNYVVDELEGITNWVERTRIVSSKNLEDYLASFSNFEKDRMESKAYSKRDERNPEVLKENGWYWYSFDNILEIREDLEKAVAQQYPDYLFPLVDKNDLLDQLELQIDGSDLTDCLDGCFLNFSREAILEQLAIRLELYFNEQGHLSLSSIVRKKVFNDTKINKAYYADDFDLANVPDEIKKTFATVNGEFRSRSLSDKINLHVVQGRISNLFNRETTSALKMEFEKKCSPILNGAPVLAERYRAFSDEYGRFFEQYGEAVDGGYAVDSFFRDGWLLCSIFSAQLSGERIQLNEEEKIRVKQVGREIRIKKSKFLSERISLSILLKEGLNLEDIHRFLYGNLKYFSEQAFSEVDRKMLMRVEEFKLAHEDLNAYIEDQISQRVFNRCGVDSVRSVELIKSLANSDCVEMVLIPDFKGNGCWRRECSENPVQIALDREGIPWRHYNFEDKESFGLLLKKECQK